MTPASFSERLDRARLPARLAYVAIILIATLSDLRIDLDPGELQERLARMLDLTVSRRDVVDGARNVVLFAGWGLLWMVTSPAGRSWRRLGQAVLSGAALSLTVESIQLLSRTRTASVLDLTTNTGGALAGALGLVVLVRMLASLTAARSYVGVPASVFALAYGAAAGLEAFLPLFRQDLRLSTAGGSWDRLGTTLAAFRWESFLEPPLGDFLLFLPAGAFVVAALAEAGLTYRRAAALATLGATVGLAGAEVAHGALGVQIHGGAALAHAAAATGGAWIAAAGLPAATRRLRGAARPRWLAVVYAVVLALWALRPYRLEASFGSILAKLSDPWWIPLGALAERADLFSVVDVTTSFLLYVPLGALLAVWPLRRRGPWAGFLPAVYLGFALELAQSLISSRWLDITDVMVQTAGVAIGWIAVRRAGFRPYGTLSSAPRGPSDSTA